jgi:hypothetical protein
MAAKRSRTPVAFMFPRQKVRYSAAVLGSWSNWEEEYEMSSVGDFYACERSLPSGQYEFKFKVDGEWQINPGLPLSKRPIPGLNNVVEVGESVRVRLRRRNVRGSTFSFKVNPLASIEETIWRAKARLGIGEDYPQGRAYEFHLKNGALLTTSDDFEDDLVSLDPAVESDFKIF